MSTINTNGINANYPVPGENNSSQGFRDNFSNIKQNFNTAASEITDLQNKVVLKQALANSTLNNDMAGTLISNATTKFFRASTYNLGNALSGLVLVDVSLGDVQYGNVVGNVTFQFGGWAPTNTESSLTLKLGISNANAVINFPNEVTSTQDGFGVTILENYSNASGVSSITVPNGVVELDYQLKTVDCGNTIYITPLNRPFQTTQIQPGVPISTGLRGDNSGAISFGPSANQVSITATTSSNVVINASVVSMPNSSINGTLLTVGNTDDAVMNLSYISGTTLNVVTLASGNIQIGMQLTGVGVTPGTTIVSNLTGSGSGSTWKVSISQTVAATTITGIPIIQEGMLLTGTGVLANTYIVSNDNGTGAGSTWNINQTQVLTGPVTITGTTGLANGRFYVGQIVSGLILEGTILSGLGVTANTTVVNNISGSGSGSIWTIDSIQFAGPTTVSGTRNAISANTTSGMYVDMPIVFTGNVFGNLVPGSTYYVKDVMTSTDFSVTLTPGGNGATYPVSSDVGSMNGDPVNYVYVCSQNYAGTYIGPKSVTNTFATTNVVKLNNIVSLQVNNPIVFVGSVFGGLTANVPFYIKSIDSGNSNITISRTIFNGIAGATYELGTANSASANACQAYSINGPDVWRQIPLLPSTSQGSNITAANITAAENLTVFGNTTLVGNLTVSGTTSYGNTAYVNISTTGNANLSNIFANNITTNTLTTNGVATFSDVSNVKIEGGLNGYYLQTDGTGNLAWVAGTTSPAPSTAAGSDTQVQYNDSGSFAGSAGFTFNDGSNTLTVANNINTSNLTATANITTANITISELINLTQVANIKLADSDSGNNGYYLQSDGLGSLVWSAGTLTPTGNGTSAGANNQVQIADGTGNFKAKAGFTFDTATDEFSTPGNFNVTGNVVSSAGIFANSGSIKGVTLEGTLVVASNAQPNITSVGTLGNLVVNGKVNANVLFANTGTSIDPDTVAGFAAGNIVEPSFSTGGNAGIVIGSTTGQHGAVIYTNNTLVFGTENGNTNSMGIRANLYSNGTFSAANLLGTVITSSQPNITQVGTLTTLNVAGNLNAGNFVGNFANGISNIRIPAAGGNINFSVSGNSNVLIVNGLGANISGNLDVTSNIVADNANAGVFAGYISANGNVTGNANVSNIVSGNLGLRALSSTYTDNVAVASESIPYAAVHAIGIPTIAAVNTNVTLSNAATFAIIGEPANGVNVNLNSANAYGLYVSGKSLLGGNIIHIGTTLNTTNVNVNGNIITSNLQVTGTANLGTNASVKISGGAIGQYLQTDGAGGLSWAAGTVIATGSGAANGTTGLVQFAKDGTGDFGAAAGFSFNTSNNALSIPGNLVATSGRVTAANFAGQISSATPSQPNITTVGTLVSLTVAGNISTSGVNSGVKTTFVGLNQDGSGNTNISNLLAVTNYVGLRAERKRYTDNAIGASGTIANAAIHVIGQPNFAASNTSVTATNATTFFIEGAPIANTNMTITNGYALWANGQSRVNGNLRIDGNLVACANVSFTQIEDLSIGNTSSYAGYYLRAVGNGSLEWASGTVVATGITAAGNTTEIQFNDAGSVTGSNAFTFNNSTNVFTLSGTANITGNLTVGTVIYNNAHSATAGQVLTVYANGLTYWATPSTSATLLANGTSNISIPNSGGNIEINGTSANYILLNGNTLATADFYIGGTLATSVKYQGARPVTNLSFLKGNTDGTTLWSTDAGSIIANGTSNVSIAATGGNIAFAVGGTIRGNVTSSGLNMAGNLIAGGVIYTNAAGSAGQVLHIYANGLTYWSTVSTSGSLIANGTSNVRITSAGSNVQIGVNGTDNILNIGSATTAITGNITATANISATNQLNGANGVIGNLTANAYIIGSGGVITDANTTRTLSATDNGKVLYFTSTSNISVTTASGLGAGFSVALIQGAAGQITVNPGAGTTRRSYGGAYKTAGTYATMSIVSPIANEFFISGQTAV